MHPIREYQNQLTRRQLFGATATGLGTAAVAVGVMRNTGHPCNTWPARYGEWLDKQGYLNK